MASDNDSHDEFGKSTKDRIVVSEGEAVSRRLSVWSE